MGLNVPEWIWINLKDILIISILSHRNKKYVLVVTRIISDISAR